MSSTTALAVVPDRRPVALAEWRNAFGWSPSIWNRMIRHLDLGPSWFDDDALNLLWSSWEQYEPWVQVPLILTFDTGVIPWQHFTWAAEMLDEFEARLPEAEGRANHAPLVARLLHSCPEVPFFGVWGTSVSENPFDPWDNAQDDYGSGIPMAEMFVFTPAGQSA